MVSFLQSLSRFRLLLIVAASIFLLLIIALSVAFSSLFQTWAARKALAADPEISGTIGRVSAGLKHVEATDVRLEFEGGVLMLPRLEAEVAVLAALFQDKLIISRLLAKDWTLDLSNTGAATVSVVQPPPRPAAYSAGPTPRASSANSNTPAPTRPPAQATAASGEPAARIHGVFDHLRLPVDVALDGVQLEGEVVLPESRGRARVAITGGGLAAGREGKFNLIADAALADPAVSALIARGTVAAVMDSPRTFAQATARLDAVASGTQFPDGVKLTADAAAARVRGDETYTASVTAADRKVLDVHAGYPGDARRVDGTWKIDVSDSDLAPFALGMQLPAFTAAGEGRFDTDATFSVFRAAGRVNATADRLGALSPQLSAVGEIKIAADFNLARRGDMIVVEKLEADLAGAQPIATVKALQSFEFHPRSAELQLADPTRELIGVVLHGVPLAWASPFLGELAVTGGDVKGNLVATPRADGIAVELKSPLTVRRASVAQSGKPLLAEIDFSLNGSADYGPHGWQVEVVELTAKRENAVLIAATAKVGQLAGQDQPVKATGRVTADLPAVLAQPVANDAVALTRGGAALDFVASVASTKELQARIAFANLAAEGAAGVEDLPDLSTDVRADVAPSGRITLNAPLLIERGDRKSDLMVAGTVTPEKDIRTIEVQITSEHLVVDDAKVLAAVLPLEMAEARPTHPRDPSPPWAGTKGVVTLHMKKVVYGDLFHVTDVAGALRIDEDGLTFDTVRAGLGDAGSATMGGVVSFDASAAPRYGLGAELVVTEFDPGPLLRALAPSQPPTLEGRFNVNSRVSGRADTLGALALGAGAELEMTSRGGVFRGLPLNVGGMLENTGRLAGLIASAGSALGALTGRKDFEDIASKAEAAAELARTLNPIAYDQLRVVLSRDAALNTVLKDFTLISPETRLTGRGRALHRPGASILDDPLSMEFTLRARGRQGELLKFLGALEPETDDLGYAACTVPITVGGTIGKPDASEFSSRVANLALEKSGITDRATDLLKRIRSGSGAPAK